MEIIPTKWFISRRNSLFTILDIQASSESKNIEKALLGMAVKVIDESQRFKAKCYTPKQLHELKDKEKTVVEFSLIFKNEEDLQTFSKFIKEYLNE